MSETRGTVGSSIDRATVIAIAVLAYTIANVVHEGLGHGGAALLLGARPTMFNAIFFDYDESTVSELGQRLIAAAGSVVNLIVAFVVLALVPRARSTRWRYFLWLFGAVNLLDAFGYLLFSGIGGIGDWARVTRGWTPALVWRLGLAASGAVLYFVVAPRLLMPLLEPFLGRDPTERVRRARSLSLVPYFAGGIALVLAGIFNPLGMKLVLISAAAASFGGTSLLAWYPTIPRPPRPETPDVPLGVERSLGWIIAAAIALLVFVVVLGPGIGKAPTAG